MWRGARSAVGRCLIGALFVGCLGWPASPAAAGWPAAALPPGLPLAYRNRLLHVADTADVSTRVEGEPFVARPDVFEYLLDHPEFATHLTRTLRLARYRIWRTPEGLFLDDGWGARGHFAVVHADRGSRVIVARGEFRQPLMPTITGEAVTMLEYAFTPTAAGRTLVRTTVTGFVRLDSRTAALVLRVGAPAAQRKADLEARRLVKVFARASRFIDDNPASVIKQLAERPETPQRELHEFARLLNVR